ncbi:Cystathionine beta-synthase, core [Akanthomyces lecanii RCEF 1005]|uniref:Cystathionine beta-synthase, core n=1 Tax=Akanthomyces lecanii RCEF 1005 TaxID=1081108 RepID=A0A168KN66_CORDF|nr:Cystathionine beta-synthase, core [Akanthomyces lecanii RCEF 1005]
MASSPAAGARVIADQIDPSLPEQSSPASTAVPPAPRQSSQRSPSNSSANLSGHRQSFAENMRAMPASPRHRPPSLTQAAVQELMNNPPTKKHGNSKFTGRDWSDITIGELVSPDDVCWVELDDSVEDATKMLLKSRTNVVLVRDSKTSNSVTSTFDYSDLNTYLLLVVGLTKPENHQVSLFNDIISKAQQGQSIPLRTLQPMFCREATVQLDASSSLAQAIETLGSGIHRIVISDLSDHVVGVMSQLRLADFFWNEGVNFPSIERLYPALLRDLSIGTQKTISVNSDSPLSEALTTMNEEGLTSVAVVDNGHNVVGNISTKDVRHLTSTSSAPLLDSSCMHFISVILNERGVEKASGNKIASHVGGRIVVALPLCSSNAITLCAGLFHRSTTVSSAGSCGASFGAGWSWPFREAYRRCFID